MSKQELIALLKSKMTGSQYPDYNGGYDSALEEVVEILEVNRIDDSSAAQPAGD
jgi:hypothetical protein